MRDNIFHPVSVCLVFGLGAACHDLPRYGDGAACIADSECREPLVCHNGFCAQSPTENTGGSSQGPFSTGGAAATGGEQSSTGGSGGAQNTTAPSTDAGQVCSLSPIRKLTYHWLGRSCSAASPHEVVFSLNEVEIARVPMADTCGCTPGVGTLEIADPALLAHGVSGVNVFRATTTGELSWVTVLIDAVEFSVQSPIWAAWPFETWNDALTQPGNFCELGYQAKLSLSGLAIDLGSGGSCE